LSAYFSATETAFSSLNKTKIKTMAEKGQKRAKLVCNLVDEYDKLISTILIGNNIVNILLSSIGTVLFVKIYGNLGATISTVVVTIVVLIFGEITPKSIAKDFPEKFAVFSAPLINFFIIIFTPLNFIFTQWKKFISKFFRIKKDIGMSQEELLMFVEEVQQDGSIDENEEQLLKNIIEFSDISAEDILTHRVDVEAVPIDISKDELINFFCRKRFFSCSCL
jgi:Mg2+/Co2+ transporter CorB